MQHRGASLRQPQVCGEVQSVSRRRSLKQALQESSQAYTAQCRWEQKCGYYIASRVEEASRWSMTTGTRIEVLYALICREQQGLLQVALWA